MPTARKVVGRAVALEKGQYPNPDGHIVLRLAGEEFDLLEGLTESHWFQPASSPVKEAEPPVRSAKGKGAPKIPDAADDIA